MKTDPHLRRVAAELRSMVAQRLARGERPRSIVVHLESLGMRRHHARHFVASVSRHCLASRHRSATATLFHEAKMVVLFGLAASVVCVLGAIGLGSLTEGMSGSTVLAGLGESEATLVAPLGGTLLAVVVAAVAHSIRSVPGVIGTLIGASAGLYFLLTGQIG